jgi:hypothetical protein
VKIDPVLGYKERRKERCNPPRKPTRPVRQSAAETVPGIDFHGASIINELGEEIPITESMVQQACKIYIKQWEMAQKSTTNN